MRKLSLVVGVLVLLWLTTARAYIGPGVAVGTFAIVLGILTSIFLAFVGILWYPIKRLLLGRKKPTRTVNQPRQDSKDSGSR